MQCKNNDVFITASAWRICQFGQKSPFLKIDLVVHDSFDPILNI